MSGKEEVQLGKEEGCMCGKEGREQSPTVKQAHRNYSTIQYTLISQGANGSECKGQEHPKHYRHLLRMNKSIAHTQPS